MENKKPKIVLIADNYCLTMVSSKKLIKENFDIFPADNGKDGLNLIMKEKPDVIVSEVAIAKGDIFSLLKKIKKNPETQNIPVVAFTLLCSKEDQEVAFEEGVSDYILRFECTPEKFVKRINRVLNGAY